MHINLSEKNKPPATVLSDFLASGEKTLLDQILNKN